MLFKQLVADENLDKGKVIAENICSVCHGVNGQANTGGNSVLVPHLTAQNEFYLTDILEIIKNKEYVQIDQHFLSYEDQYQILGVNTPEQLKEISMRYSNFL